MRSRAGLYEFLEDEFSKILYGAKVLTIGSGGDVNSLLDKFAKLNDFHVVSFDIDKDRSPDIRGDVCNYEFSYEQFDVIIMAEALEHFHSPHDAIENLYNALKSTGKLIITVPFIFPIHDRPYDYQRFTRYGLEFLLKKFSKISISEKNNWGEAMATLLVRHIIETYRGRHIIVCIGIVLMPLLRVIGRIFPTDAITTGYHVVAVK